MIADLCLGFIRRVIGLLPVVSLPSGATAALTFLSSVVGFINVFLSLARLAPIAVFVLALRNYKVIMSLVRALFYFLPFVG